jgi:ABC-type transport system involved in multi-copper enzyme maturation permease subunit
MTTLSVLIRKETLSHLLSLRFHLLIGLVLTLMLGGALVFRGDLERRTGDFEAAEADRLDQLTRGAERSMPLFQLFSYYDQPVMARPGALGFVSEGRERDLPNVVMVNAFRVQGPQIQQRGNPMLPSFELIDWSFVLCLVLSFAALVLTFDGFAGERAEGTLRLLLAHPVPRWQLVVAKFGAAWGLLVVAFLLGALLQLLLLTSGGTLVLDGVVAGKLGLAVMVVAFGTAVFVLLGLLVSARHRHPSAALVVSLLVWTFLVIVVPRGSALVAQGLSEVESLDEVETRAEAVQASAVESYLRLHPKKENRWISGHWSPQESLDLAFLVGKTYDGPFEEWRDQQIGQVALARRLARVSPVVVAAEGLEALAGTGLAGYRRFLTAALRYRSDLAERLRALYPLDPVNAPGLDEEAHATLAEVRVAPSVLPVFDNRPPPLGEAFTASLRSLTVLAGMTLLLFLAAVVAAVRYDVR